MGAPKCATSALTDYLATHPQIFMAQKEMHFFGHDLHFAANFYRRDEQEYLAAFKNWSGQQQIGESSVWYLFSKTAATEIKAFNPDARIIIMVRDPAEMLHSLYYTFRADRNEPLATFREALAAEGERRAGRRVSRNTYFRQGLIYHDVPRYTEQIQRYFEIFGRDQVHVVTYDDFAAKTDAVFAGVLDFLGVKLIQPEKKFPVINGNHSLKIPLLQTIMGDPLIRGTAIAMRSWLPGPIFITLQKIENWVMKSNSRCHKRPQLDSDLWQRLKQEFTPEVRRLSKLLGRDLMHWNSIKPPTTAQSLKFEVVSCHQVNPEPAFETSGQAARSAS